MLGNISEIYNNKKLDSFSLDEIPPTISMQRT